MKWFIRLAVLGAAIFVLLKQLGYEVIVGSLILNQEGLQALRQKGAGRPHVVVGGCVISDDIDATALAEVIPQLVVVGGLVGPRAVADAYGPRLKSIGGIAFRESSQ